MNADNKKIGIAIYKASQGFSELSDFSLNKSDTWASKIVDIRTDLSKIENLEANRSICMIMPLKDGDYFIVVVSLINGTRSNDNITAWIYVPNTVNENCFSKIYDLTKAVKDQISTQNFNKSNIEKILGEIQYETDIAKWINLESIKSCKTIGYYKLNAEKFSLKDVLDVDCLNSPSFRKYERVFLIEDDLKCLSCEEIELPEHISKSIVIEPLNQLKANGFIPYIGEKEFSNKIRIFVGEKITIVWKNKKDDRYDKIEKSVVISQGFKDNELYPNLDDYKLTIKEHCVEVIDAETGETIEKYELRINGQTNNFKFIAQKLESANIMVGAKDYEVYNGQHNLKDNKQITVKLEKKMNKYNVSIEDAHSLLNASIESKEKIEKSPIKGYKIEKITSNGQKNKTIKLRYDRFDKTTYIILIIAFLIGAGLSFGTTYYFMNKKIDELKLKLRKETNELNKLKSSQTAEYNKPQEPSSSESYNAIDYLNNHDEWVKSDMEKIQGLKGLWDALVGYKSKDILKFENTLKESDKFKRILDKIDAIKDKNEKFSAENETIVFDNYMKNLNKPSTTQQAKSGNSNKNSKTGKENKLDKKQQSDPMFQK